MMHLPHRLIWSQLSRHKSKFGVQRCLHEMTPTQPPTAKPPAATQPPTVPSQPPVPPSHTGTKEVKEIQIPVPWGHISGKWWGRTDVQPVLMLHGWQDNASTFDTLAPLLENESLLAFDAIGHGRSSHYPLGQCYTHADFLVGLRLVVGHLGLGGGRVSLVGHSMGSAIAYAYAAGFPEAVDRLVSLDDIRGALVQTLPPPGAGMRRVIETNLSYERRLADEGSRPAYSYSDVVDLYWRGCDGSVTRESAETILSRGLSGRGERYRLSRDPRVKVLSWDSMSEAHALATASLVACEVLSVRAAQSFTSKPRALAMQEKCREAMEANAKRLECHVVEGTHHVHLNTPEIVAPLINRFFQAKDDNLVY